MAGQQWALLKIRVAAARRNEERKLPLRKMTVLSHTVAASATYDSDQSRCGCRARRAGDASAQGYRLKALKTPEPNAAPGGRRFIVSS
jgi:hypothetical protein